MEKVYKISGLAKPNCIRCETVNEDTFDVKHDLSRDKFNELWNYFDGDWSEKKYALIQYNQTSHDGVPIDAILKEIILTPCNQQK